MRKFLQIRIVDVVAVPLIGRNATKERRQSERASERLAAHFSPPPPQPYCLYPRHSHACLHPLTPAPCSSSLIATPPSPLSSLGTPPAYSLSTDAITFLHPEHLTWTRSLPLHLSEPYSPISKYSYFTIFLFHHLFMNHLLPSLPCCGFVFSFLTCIIKKHVIHCLLPIQYTLTGPFRTLINFSKQSLLNFLMYAHISKFFFNQSILSFLNKFNRYVW